MLHAYECWRYVPTYVCTTRPMLMADKKFPTVVVWWEGNNSKWYDGTKEEILLSNVVAVQRCCDQQDGCHWTFLWSVKCWRSHWVRVRWEERESAAVVWSSCFHRSNANRHASSASNELETTSKWMWCRRTRTTTKEASRLSTTDSDKAEHPTAATLSFENSSSTKGKWQKHPSSLPLRAIKAWDLIFT